MQKVDGFENWDVITAGLVPPDPTLLLGSERMQNLIKEIINSKEYTYIILDSPRVLGLAVASLISSFCIAGMLLRCSLESTGLIGMISTRKTLN